MTMTMNLNLFLISQDTDGYGVYEAAVVCAETESEARTMHPSGEVWDGKHESLRYEWCDMEDVQVKIIGAAARNIEKGVVLADYFN